MSVSVPPNFVRETDHTLREASLRLQNQQKAYSVLILNFEF
ncbi:hypothetical protein FDUTEX481_05743 [Tolypothrix sp. PCC 7601]|nr:hypothetical protein FDUTEX481_05743 [Tolypothrix sp. PCC 7601]